MKVIKREVLTEFVNFINSQTFFKEFSFSKNCFIPKEGTELELSDYVLFFDGYLIIFQLKERSRVGESVQSEIKWIKNKIEKKAKNQLKKSLKYLTKANEISVQNERGDILDIKISELQQIHNVIVYLYPERIPAYFVPIKFYRSEHIGFIHIFDFISYKNICEILFTPIEIINYLNFREQYLSLILNARKETEKYLLGRYLISPKVVELDIDTKDEDFSKYVDNLEHTINEFDMRNIFQSIREKMSTTQGNELDYYKFITELALLNRLELKGFKDRFSFALKKIESNEFNINRMISGKSNCGFVFISLLEEEIDKRIELSKMITHLAKYDMKVEKILGVTFIKESKAKILIYWTYIEYPWVSNSETEKLIKESNLFKPLKLDISVLYKFNH